jgi:hypothetical protein
MPFWMVGVSQGEPHGATGGQHTPLGQIHRNGRVQLNSWNRFEREDGESGPGIDKQRPETPVHACLDVNHAIPRLEWHTMLARLARSDCRRIVRAGALPMLRQREHGGSQ